jgi:regulator of protease activity HflC (stomatin/prohibitin superfamily)
LDAFGWILLLLGVMGVATAAVTLVPPGKTYVVERFGRPRRVLGPGLHLVVPFLDQVRERGPSNGPPDVV